MTAAALAVVPVPVKVTDCGEPLALSAMLRVALFDPAETGLKVTESAQLAPAASVVPQVFDNRKSSASTPVTAIELKETLEEPLLVTVTA